MKKRELIDRTYTALTKNTEIGTNLIQVLTITTDYVSVL